MSIMYKVCKRTIEMGNYPEDMKMRVNVFYSGGLITTEEYNKLIAMISE